MNGLDDDDDYEGPEHFEDPSIRSRWLGGHRRAEQPVEDSPLWASQLDQDDEEGLTAEELTVREMLQRIVLGTIYILALLFAVPMIVMAIAFALGFLKVLWPYG